MFGVGERLEPRIGETKVVAASLDVVPGCGARRDGPFVLVLSML